MRPRLADHQAGHGAGLVQDDLDQFPVERIEVAGPDRHDRGGAGRRTWSPGESAGGLAGPGASGRAPICRLDAARESSRSRRLERFDRQPEPASQGVERLGHLHVARAEAAARPGPG